MTHCKSKTFDFFLFLLPVNHQTADQVSEERGSVGLTCRTVHVPEVKEQRGAAGSLEGHLKDKYKRV